MKVCGHPPIRDGSKSGINWAIFFFLNISESEKKLCDVFIKENLQNREKHKEENKI